MATQYPHLPHLSLGVSGATLLLNALQQTNRRRLILPAFICPELSAMAVRAGLEVIHVDADRRTLHMDAERLDACLKNQSLSDTALVVDHTFGYADREIISCRRSYPDLLIIEDCVRALGSEIDGTPVGAHGDWVLFSMYKTTTGNDDGAVLLTGREYPMPHAAARPPSPRQWVSSMAPLRKVHGLLKRRRGGMEPAARDADAPRWEPVVREPNWLTVRRFTAQLNGLTADRARREAAASTIRTALADAPRIVFIEAKPGCRSSAFFLSLTIDGGRRDAIVNRLHREGLFLVWAWNAVPAFYRCFADTFPFGFSNSVYLADHVCHVPLAEYVDARHRKRLITSLRHALGHA